MGQNYSQCTTNISGVEEANVHDWEDEWRTAWDDYCTDTEHSVGP